MKLNVVSTSQLIPSYTHDLGDCSNDEAAKAAAQLARGWSRQINGATVESDTQFDPLTLEYNYAFIVKARAWGCVIPKMDQIARINILP